MKVGTKGKVGSATLTAFITQMALMILLLFMSLVIHYLGDASADAKYISSTVLFGLSVVIGSIAMGTASKLGGEN